MNIRISNILNFILLNAVCEFIYIENFFPSNLSAILIMKVDLNNIIRKYDVKIHAK